MHLMYTLDDFLRLGRSLDVIDNINPPDYQHTLFDLDLSCHIGG